VPPLAAPIAPAQAAQLIANLRRELGESMVDTSADEIAFVSQDYYQRGLDVLAILRPADLAELQRFVQAAAGQGLAIYPRGGGWSYTSGYLATRPGVLIDMQAMDRVLEINETDNYVTVEAGCSWARLDAALGERGLRTPFWGPLSGIQASVGGGISQGSISLGSGVYGVSSESVLDMDIVLANGDVIKTGTSGQAGHPPFFRNYGPDLTGLFCSDCGALGIKASVTLRLMKRPTHTAGLSFGFATFADCVAAGARVATENVACDNLGVETKRLEEAAAGTGLADNFKTLIAIGRSANGPLDAVRRMVRAAFAGKKLAGGHAYSMHHVVEGTSQAMVDAKAAIVRRAVGESGHEIANTVPNALRAEPFARHPMLAPNGQRQLPPSTILPFSTAAQCHDEFLAGLEAFKTRMAPFNMNVLIVMATVGTNGFLFEPVIAWDDVADEFHQRQTPDEMLDKIAHLAAAPEARALAGEIRQLMIDTAFRHGGVHLQIGKTYPYLHKRDDGPVALLQQIKDHLDPARIMNPGALGLS